VPAISAALSGRTIVVTRPAAQCAALAAAIEAEGGTALRFPLLEISPLPDCATLEAIAHRLDAFDFACFVSPNAVEHALPVLLRGRAWPAHLQAVTVGGSSEAALARYGIGRVIAPRERFDSEALLALPALAADNLAGRRAVIFRGEGGRELLGDTLSARGATVEYVTCYRRSRPAGNANRLVELARAGRLDALVLSSSEGVGNLINMLGEAASEVLARTTLFVPHARIGERARELGAPRVVLTGPADAGLLAGLLSHFCNR
jgi:uroporphyrinogen-III synthase